MRRRKSFRPLRGESLEARLNMALLLVNSTSDNTDADTELTLREAIALTNNVGDENAALGRLLTAEEAAQINALVEPFGLNDTINFDVALLGGTIVLGGTELAITTSVSINGPGADQLTISGDNASRIINVDDGTPGPTQGVSMLGLTLADGATGGDGGAILSGEVLSLQDLRFSNNHATGDGGGLRDVDGLVFLSGASFTGNSGNNGGAISSTGQLILSDAYFEGNQATGYGGAIASVGYLSLVASTVAGNVAFVFGGGIATSGMGVIDSSTIANNTAVSGGGISASGFDLRIFNSTISENSATEDGGGILQAGPLVVSNSTVVLNRADAEGNGSGIGGGVHTAPGQSTTLVNSIVAGNLVGTGSSPNDLEGAVEAASASNVIGDVATAGGLADGVNGNRVGFAVGVIVDLLLADNGGPTWTHALIPGSPAIDAGDNDLALDDQGRPLSNDQRGGGFPRIVGSRVDVGAVEFADRTPPHLVSITDTAFNGQVLLSRPHVFMLTFDKDIQEVTVDPSDFTNAGTASITIGSMTETIPGVFEIEVIPDTLGTVILALSPTALIYDLAGNAVVLPAQDETELQVIRDLLVTTDVDEDDGDDLASLSLREAVRLANEIPGENSVTFALGVHVIDLTIGSLKLEDTARTTITGPNVVVRRSNALATPDFAILEVGVAAVATVDGLTLAEGSQGGVINSGDLTLRNGLVVNNMATTGGGIANFGQLTLTDTVVSGNSAQDGAGIFNPVGGAATLLRAQVNANTATGNGGGVSSAGDMTITLSTIGDNTAQNGGGIESSGNLDIVDSLIAENVAANEGGGVKSTGPLRVLSSTIADNRAHDGGGIASYRSLSVVNSTLSGNVVVSAGGGMFVLGLTTITQSTIVGNQANTGNLVIADGGGIYSARTDLRVNNSVIAGNFNGASPNEFGGFDIHSASASNLIGDADSAGGLFGGDNDNLIGFDASDVLDLTLANNGGPTPTHKLIAGSPAIDAGNNALAVDHLGAPLTTDQRGAGFDRIRGGRVDIGAFELLDGAPPTVVSIVDSASGPDIIVLRPHRYTVTFSEDINAATVNANDFVNAGTAAVTLGDITETIPGVFTVEVTPTTPGTVILRLPVSASILDVNGNAFVGPTQDDDTLNAITDLVVNTLTDEDNGDDLAHLSLREAVRLANQIPDPNAISFAAGFNNLLLTIGTLVMTDAAPTVIVGPVTIARDTGATTREFGVFEIAVGATALLDLMTITGGVGSGGGIRNAGNATASRMTVTGNKAPLGASGGGIFNAAEGTLSLTTVVVSENVADVTGGGIFNAGSLTLERTVVTRNTANQGGGGIYGGGPLSIIDSIISLNSAFGGGGVYTLGTTSILGSTIRGNVAGYAGGGVLITSAVEASIVNSTISGNSAGALGGGIATDSVLAIANATIAFNSAGEPDVTTGSGGGILTFSSPAAKTTLNNTIVASNIIEGLEPSVPNNLAGKNVDVANSSHNLVDSLTSTGGLSNTNGNRVGVPADLLPLADNGGFTQTHALGAASHARNAGGNALIPSGVTTDQRGLGFGRLLGGTVDIGAFETGFANSSVNLLSSVNPSLEGQTITFTAQIVGSGATPTGTVVFVVDGANQPPVALVNGVATLITSTLTPGSHSITANYSGDAVYSASSSTALSQSITDFVAATSTAVTSNNNPQYLGSSVTFTATISSLSGTPTGTVTFLVDNAAVSTATLNAGVAIFTTSSLTEGTHVVSARYNGNADYLSSTGTLPGGQTITNYDPADVDRNRVIEIDDIIYLIDFYARNRSNLPLLVANFPPGSIAADVDRNGRFDIDDIITWIFLYSRSRGSGEGELPSLAASADEALSTPDELFPATVSDAELEAIALSATFESSIRKRRG